MSEKIVIIKLGALGDVVRTLSILPALKEKYPNSEICWITKPSSKPILKTNPHINKILTIPVEVQDSFDILYNLDIDDDATQLANKISANKKYGFFSEEGFVSAFNLPAEYYLNTLFDDELKKSNQKTYQQMMFEAIELDYNNQHSSIHLIGEDKEYAHNFIKKNNISSNRLIGIHIGASSRWPSKKWHADNLKEFITKANFEGYNILLFAGPDEKKEQENLVLRLKEKGIKIYKNNPDNTINQFSSLVNLCDVVISGDTLAMHVALALKKPTIGLFFCTSPHEVEEYGLLHKIISPQLYNFFPEKMDQYNEELVKSISAEEVINSLKEIKKSEQK